MQSSLIQVCWRNLVLAGRRGRYCVWSVASVTPWLVFGWPCSSGTDEKILHCGYDQRQDHRPLCFAVWWAWNEEALRSPVAGLQPCSQDSGENSWNDFMWTRKDFSVLLQPSHVHRKSVSLGRHPLPGLNKGLIAMFFMLLQQTLLQRPINWSSYYIWESKEKGRFENYPSWTASQLCFRRADPCWYMPPIGMWIDHFGRPWFEHTGQSRVSTPIMWCADSSDKACSLHAVSPELYFE